MNERGEKEEESDSEEDRKKMIDSMKTEVKIRSEITRKKKEFCLFDRKAVGRIFQSKFQFLHENKDI